MTRQTTIIDAETIAGAFTMADYVATVEEAFCLCGRGEVQMPPKLYLTFPQGDLRCMPVCIPNMNTAGVKNVNVHPGNTDLPTVMATITLIDPETGFPLAIMDGTHITRMRTGAAGGVAAKYLSRENSRTAAFIGAGAQAQTQLAALLVTRPAIEKVIACDIRREHLEHFVEIVRSTHGREVLCTPSIQQAAEHADILVTTTTVRVPVVHNDWIKPGTHINAIGADAPGKQELDPAILNRAIVVVDNWEQASHSGEINVPVSHGLLTRDDIHADIGQIVCGAKPARQTEDEITVFDSTGLAVQDISAATAIYRKLTADQNTVGRLTHFKFF
ncbi:MAG: ornithine cyclodeaminase family protein [Phycisphaerae bacterium]|nr:ornithine cyclodeaminase family protein [Phycisphaerae bacterium]